MPQKQTKAFTFKNKIAQKVDEISLDLDEG